MFHLSNKKNNKQNNNFYNYHVVENGIINNNSIIENNSIINNNTRKYNVKAQDDLIEYYSYHKPMSTSYTDLRKNRIKSIINKYLFFIISLCLFCYSFCFLDNIIVEIEIKNNVSNIDTSIVTSKLTKIGPVYYLKNSLTSIKEQIKDENDNLMFIEIAKVGTKLVLTENNYNNPNYTNNNSYDNLYAKYDGFVLNYYVRQGKIMIQNNMYVKKGDLLISGLITGYVEDQYISPSGYVIAQVANYETIAINKSYFDNSKTGKVKIVKTFFPNKVKPSFDNYTKKEVKLFSFLPLYKVYLYETNNKKVNITKEEAKNLAISKIENKYNLLFEYDNEKIVSINLINCFENNDTFYVKYLVKVNINIC